ncbi:MAG: acetolactate synthase small subunit [Lachnospiraceae bacterium]
MKKVVFSLLVKDTAGVLSRIAGLFARRGYNIDTISAGVTEDSQYTRITVVARGDDNILEQIRQQITKLEDVVKVIVLDADNSVCRELLLAKVRANKKEKQEIIAMADVFRAKIVDVAKDSIMVELTGNLNKIDAFIELLYDFDVIEIVRTGLTGLTRGVVGIKELIR